MKFDRVSSARGLAGLAVAAVAFGVICAGSERPETSAAAAAAPEVKSPFLPANKPGRFADVKSLMNKGKAPSTMKARMFLGEDLPDPPQHFPVGTSCGIDDALPANCQLPDQGGHGPDGIVATNGLIHEALVAALREELKPALV